MKRILPIILAALMLIGVLSACSPAAPEEPVSETTMFTDSCGREVEIPVKIDKVAPSGSVAQMILATVAPEKLVGIANTPAEAELKYFPNNFAELPIFGQFYGSKASLNMEALIAAAPQITIDLGDMKKGHDEDMTSVQESTGIPTIFVESGLSKLGEAYRTLGKLLDVEEKAESLAKFVDETMSVAAENSAKITDENRVSVMYCTGESGLNVQAKGSIQAAVLDLVGAENAIVLDDFTNAGTGTALDLEQIYVFDPDVIIVTQGGGYQTITESADWAELTAVKNGRVYEIPASPYCWMSNPPSVNMLLGVWWLGNLVYPELYDYDMAEKATEYYKLFFNYDLTADEAAEFLANSTLK